MVAALAGLLWWWPVAGAGEDLIGMDEQVARIDVCYDFGCRSIRRVYLFDDDWQRVARVLRGAHSPAEERTAIARAVGVMEEVVGAMSPTGEDRAGNDYVGEDAAGQLDCIDESTNTTAYLTLFQEQGLLVHHRVAERVYRAPLLIDQHWAAQVREIASGKGFAVDSWLRDNGQPALVLPVERWARADLQELALSNVGLAPAPD